MIELISTYLDYWKVWRSLGKYRKVSRKNPLISRSCTQTWFWVSFYWQIMFIIADHEVHVPDFVSDPWSVGCKWPKFLLWSSFGWRMQRLFHLSRLLFLLWKDLVSALKCNRHIVILPQAKKLFWQARWKPTSRIPNNRNYHIVIVNIALTNTIKYWVILNVFTQQAFPFVKYLLPSAKCLLDSFSQETVSASI